MIIVKKVIFNLIDFNIGSNSSLLELNLVKNDPNEGILVKFWKLDAVTTWVYLKMYVKFMLVHINLFVDLRLHI